MRSSEGDLLGPGRRWARWCSTLIPLSSYSESSRRLLKEWMQQETSAAGRLLLCSFPFTDVVENPFRTRCSPVMLCPFGVRPVVLKPLFSLLFRSFLVQAFDELSDFF